MHTYGNRGLHKFCYTYVARGNHGMGSERVTQREPFLPQLKRFRKKMENLLKRLPRTSFRNCYQQCQHRMQKCVNAEGNCFEGDMSQITNSVSIYNDSLHQSRFFCVTPRIS
ncbi:hypothetical protein TNCV_4718441 [Trichonephila clavipes]|nr:hypothetical protein TNCV_4718441 [Trichonephila clavipes]